MRDVGERAAVDERRGMLEGLHEVRLQRVLEQRGHRALCIQVACGDGLFVIGVADDEARQTLLEVGDVGSEAEHCHDLGGDGDVVAVLTRGAVDSAAQAVHDEAELTVVHIDAAAPGDAAGVNAEAVALINMVIQHGGKEVVRSADGVEVAGEVQVDVLHGDDLCVAAACRAALDAEDRPEGRLAERDEDVLAQLAHAVSQTDGRGGLAFACGSGVDGGDEDQLAVLALDFLEDVVVNLCLVLAVLFDVLVVDACGLCDLSDRQHLGFLCDFDVGFETHLEYLLIIKFCAAPSEWPHAMSLSYRCRWTGGAVPFKTYSICFYRKNCITI